MGGGLITLRNLGSIIVGHKTPSKDSSTVSQSLLLLQHIGQTQRKIEAKPYVVPRVTRLLVPKEKN